MLDIALAGIGAVAGAVALGAAAIAGAGCAAGADDAFGAEARAGADGAFGAVGALTPLEAELIALPLAGDAADADVVLDGAFGPLVVSVFCF